MSDDKKKLYQCSVAFDFYVVAKDADEANRLAVANASEEISSIENPVEWVDEVKVIDDVRESDRSLIPVVADDDKKNYLLTITEFFEKK